MTDWKTEIRNLIASLNLSPAQEAEIVEELTQHAEDRVHDLACEGFTEAEAIDTALSELRASRVSLDDLKHLVPQAQVTPVVLGAGSGRSLTMGIWQDLRYALRMLVKQRSVTLVAIATMALGIGVNTTVFSTLELVVYRPFAFANQQRLFMLWQQQPEVGIRRGSVSPGDFNDWREHNHSFERLAAFTSAEFDVSDRELPERIAGNRVSADFFDALGTPAELGRTFAPGDYEHGEDHVAVLKHSFWQSHFGSDQSAIGRAVRISNHDFTIVGVMPEGFDFPVGGGNLWVPLVFNPLELVDRGTHNLQVIGLPRSGVEMASASEDLNLIAARAQHDYPNTNRGRGVRVVSLVEDLTHGARVGAPFMFLSVLLVLLVACANVANLLLVRAASRQREIAVRLALGASRLRVMRQLLADSMLLALFGGALGLLLSAWCIKTIRAVPQDFARFIPGWEQMGIDRTALVFTLAVSIITGLLCGLIPAITGTKLDINEALKEGGRGVFGSNSHRTHRLLVISEIAVSMVLLIGAGVMFKSFTAMQRTNMGIDPAHVATMQVSLDEAKYASTETRVNFYKALIERTSTLPGVLNAGVIGTLPLGYTYNNRECSSIGEEEFPLTQRPSITWRVATPGYFGAIGTSLHSGRLFTEQDTTITPAVAIVNDAFVKEYLQNHSTIGAVFKSGNGKSYEIVGVVANVVNDDFDGRAEPEIYVPFAQEPWTTAYLVIRSDSELSLTASIRREVSMLDPAVPVFNVKSMGQLVDERMSPKRMAVYGLAGSGLIGLVLAAVGVYALMSYTVTQQSQEIGLRLALGATTGNISRLIIKRGMLLVVIGCGFGLAGAWGLTRLLSGLLNGVSANDPATFVSVAFILNIVALISCYLPARRASRVDPMVALRRG